MDPTSQSLFYEFGSGPKPPRYYLVKTKEEVEAAFREDVARLRGVRDRALDAFKGRPLGRARKTWLAAKLTALMPENYAQSASIQVIRDNLDRYRDIYTIFGTLDLLYVDGIDDLRAQYAAFIKPKSREPEAEQEKPEEQEEYPDSPDYSPYSPDSPPYSPASHSPPRKKRSLDVADVEFVNTESLDERLEKLRQKAETDGAIVEIM